MKILRPTLHHVCVANYLSLLNRSLAYLCLACYTLQYTSTRGAGDVTFWDQFLDDIDGDVGEDGIFKADYVKQVKDAAESVFLNMRTACKVTESVNIRACYLNKSSITKAQLVEWLETTVCLLNSYTVPLLDFAVEHQSELEELKSEKIADRRKIIDL